MTPAARHCGLRHITLARLQGQVFRKGHAFGAELSKLCIPLKPGVLHITEGRMAFFHGVFPH